MRPTGRKPSGAVTRPRSFVADVSCSARLRPPYRRGLSYRSRSSRPSVGRHHCLRWPQLGYCRGYREAPVNDPAEPVNRAIFSANQAVDRAIVRRSPRLSEWGAKAGALWLHDLSMNLKEPATVATICCKATLAVPGSRRGVCHQHHSRARGTRRRRRRMRFGSAQFRFWRDARGLGLRRRSVYRAPRVGSVEPPRRCRRRNRHCS